MVNLNFVTFPILTTARLTLRPLSAGDSHAIFDLRSDPEINNYLDRQQCNTTEDALNFIIKINNSIEKHKALYWAITLTDTKTFAGTICLFDFSSEKNSCEMGFELMTKFQRQGIMNEAVKLVIDFVFLSLRCKKILAMTHRDNINSIKLLTKFNFIKSIEPDQENSDLNIFTLQCPFL